MGGKRAGRGGWGSDVSARRRARLKAGEGREGAGKEAVVSREPVVSPAWRVAEGGR